MDRWHRERMQPLRHRLAHGHLREHLARYRWGADFLRGRVLDAGCGTGYGSLMLAAAAGVQEVVGVDTDRRAIEHARRFYRAPGVRFHCLDLLAGGMLNLGTFDGIACLEVLEHLDEPQRLIETLHLLLAPGGRLWISTPLGRGRHVGSLQEGHLFQLRREEFEALLAPRFQHRLFGQKGEQIEPWRRGGRYFLMSALCGARLDEAAGRRPPVSRHKGGQRPGEGACGTSG